MPIARHHLAKKLVTGEEIHYFLSTEQTGDGSMQSIPHGLGVTPTLVIINITGSPGTYVALAVTEGTHDATNVKVTVTTGWKYRVLAIQ